MKYRYRGTGMIVESGDALDSMIFEPVEEVVETVDTSEDLQEPADMMDGELEKQEDVEEVIGAEWLTDAQAEAKKDTERKPAAKTTAKKPATKIATRKR